MSTDTNSAPNKNRRRRPRAEGGSETLESRVTALELDAHAETSPSEPPVKMLTQDELHRLRVLELEVRAARAESETCRLRKKWLLALLDPKGTVEAEEKRQEKWQRAMRAHAQQYETLKARVSMRLNIDLNKCGFDPETGVVVPPDPSATGNG